jgi:hypothetical protein
MKTFYVGTVNDVEAKWQYHIGISGVPLWKTWMIQWTAIGLEKLLEKV